MRGDGCWCELCESVMTRVVFSRPQQQHWHQHEDSLGVPGQLAKLCRTCIYLSGHTVIQNRMYLRTLPDENCTCCIGISVEELLECRQH